MDAEENKYLSNIYIYNEESKSVLKLTSLDEERSFVWKDNNKIIFPSVRGKNNRRRKESNEEFTTYYEIDINGGEAEKLFEIPLNAGALEFIDENRLLVTAVCNNLPEEKDGAEYEIFDEVPFWSNGAGFTNKKRNRLYIYDLKDNEIIPITDEYSNVSRFSLSRDKSMIAVIMSTYTDKAHRKTELYMYDIKEITLIRLSHDESVNYVYADFMNDKIIFAVRNMKAYGKNENPHFYLMDMDGKNAVRISDDEFDYDLSNSVASDCRYGSSKSMMTDGDYLYFVTTIGYSSHINRIDRSGIIETLTEDNGSVDDFDVVNGKLRFTGLRGLRLQELYSIEGKREYRLTSFNEWVTDEEKLSKPEYLGLDVNGETVDGWVLKPVDFEENKKYPAILDIHGGPKKAYGEVFYHEMQYWANEGYFVFFCNPRGSDGKGNEFANVRGKNGTMDYDDIMNFTDLVLEKYTSIDSGRMGVTGGSYGGFMTNWIIGHTGRFKAAVSQRSISNWISFYGTMDIGYHFADDFNAGAPWLEPALLWEQSPVKYASRVTTPTLFIHSAEDYRCCLSEGIQMFSFLKYYGVESKFCMFKGENHELSRSGKVKNRIKRLKEITDWFDKYLK